MSSLERMGGVERFLINLLTYVDREKFELSLMLGCKKNGVFVADIPKDIKVISLNVSHMRYSLFKLIKYFRKEKPDVFVSFMAQNNIVSIVAKVLSGAKVKIILSERNNYSAVCKYCLYKISQKITLNFIYPVFMKIFYLKSDGIICVSKGVADDLAKIIGSSPKIKVVHNYFDFEKIIKLSKEEIDYAKVNPNNLPTICAVGRLAKEKDYSTLLKAFSIILRSANSRLIIVGEGRESGKLEMLVRQLNISNSVYFAGLQKNSYKFMSKADIFVLSSVNEGLPNALVEAMVCGVPVVSTDCESGPNEVIYDGENGFLVPIRDEKALADAVLKLLKDQGLREKFSIKGREKVLQQFSFEKTIKEYEKIFEEAVVGHNCFHKSN